MLLKNAHLLRLRFSCFIAAYEKVRPFCMIACKPVSETARALHLGIFEQPVFIDFFNNLLKI